MSQNQNNSFIVTASGVFGGVCKALTAHFVLVNITFQGIFEVAFYAAISALVGYGVKVGIDKVKKLSSHKRK